MKKNKIFFKSILTFVYILLYSQNFFALDLMPQKPDAENLSPHILEKANTAFSNKNYGLAFKLAETAKEQRKKESKWALVTLDQVLKQPAVLKLGTDIYVLLDFLKERQSTDAVMIFESLLDKYGADYFKNSVKNLLEFLRQNSAYPEADYLLGMLYMIEGEYKTADAFYSAAYANRSLLDIPDMHIDILYDMAELYRIQGKMEQYEEALLLIASEDTAYKINGKISPYLGAALSAIEKGMSSDKFFLLYRNNYYKTMKVWFYFTKYYKGLGLDERALETIVLFVLTAVARADDVLRSRDIQYNYETLIGLFKKIKTFPELTDWSVQNHLWEGFYLLAQITEKKGFSSFSQDLYMALALECPEINWQNLAKKTANN